MSRKVAVLIGLYGVIGFALWRHGPIPQPEVYLHFADQRTWLGIPNFADVISNLAFVVVGWQALLRLRTMPLPHAKRVRYQVFFASLFFVAAGSAYFHWQPNLTRLLFDRLPMTVTFTTLISLVAAEVFGDRIGRRLWWPLMLFGVGSVLWWFWTEQHGHGDLRAYLFVQFGAMLFVIACLVLFQPARVTARSLVALVLLYGLAKGAEVLDEAIFTWSGMISGHTIKHLLAAAAVWPVTRMAAHRRRDDAISDAHKGR